MKLRQDITISTTDHCMLQLGDFQKQVKSEYEYIITALQQGMTKENDLIQLIAKTDQTDEIIAGFKLTQFVIDYGKFLAEPDEHIIIEA